MSADPALVIQLVARGRAFLEECTQTLRQYRQVISINDSRTWTNNNVSTVIVPKDQKTYSDMKSRFNQYTNTWTTMTGDFARFAVKKAELENDRKYTGQGYKPNCDQWCKNDNGQAWGVGADRFTGGCCDYGFCSCKRTAQQVMNELNEFGYEAARPTYTNWCRSQPQPQAASATQIDWCADKPEGTYPNRSMYGNLQMTPLPPLDCCANVIGNVGTVENVSQSCTINMNAALEQLNTPAPVIIATPPTNISSGTNNTNPNDSNDTFETTVVFSGVSGSMVVSFLIVLVLVIVSGKDQES